MTASEKSYWMKRSAYLMQPDLKLNMFMAILAGNSGARREIPFPTRTQKLLEEHKIGLFGAITSKPKDKTEAELAPELKGKGFIYYSPIVSMRQKYDLDICMRPCKDLHREPAEFHPPRIRRCH